MAEHKYDIRVHEQTSLKKEYGVMIKAEWVCEFESCDNLAVAVIDRSLGRHYCGEHEIHVMAFIR